MYRGWCSWTNSSKQSGGTAQLFLNETKGLGCPSVHQGGVKVQFPLQTVHSTYCAEEGRHLISLCENRNYGRPSRSVVPADKVCMHALSEHIFNSTNLQVFKNLLISVEHRSIHKLKQGWSDLNPRCSAELHWVKMKILSVLWLMWAGQKAQNGRDANCYCHAMLSSSFSVSASVPADCCANLAVLSLWSHSVKYFATNSEAYFWIYSYSWLPCIFMWLFGAYISLSVLFSKHLFLIVIVKMNKCSV